MRAAGGYQRWPWPRASQAAPVCLHSPSRQPCAGESTACEWWWFTRLTKTSRSHVHCIHTLTHTCMCTCTGLRTINEPTSPPGLDAMQAVQDVFVTQIVWTYNLFWEFTSAPFFINSSTTDFLLGQDNTTAQCWRERDERKREREKGMTYWFLSPFPIPSCTILHSMYVYIGGCSSLYITF